MLNHVAIHMYIIIMYSLYLYGHGYTHTDTLLSNTSRKYYYYIRLLVTTFPNSVLIKTEAPLFALVFTRVSRAVHLAIAPYR